VTGLKFHDNEKSFMAFLCMTFCGLFCGYQHCGGIHYPDFGSKSGMTRHEDTGLHSLEIYESNLHDVLESIVMKDRGGFALSHFGIILKLQHQFLISC